MAREAGWQILEPPRLTLHDVPYFKDMFIEIGKRVPKCTFYGFTNADILFTFNLMKTLEAVEKVRLCDGFFLKCASIQIVLNISTFRF